MKYLDNSRITNLIYRIFHVASTNITIPIDNVVYNNTKPFFDQPHMHIRVIRHHLIKSLQ